MIVLKPRKQSSEKFRKPFLSANKERYSINSDSQNKNIRDKMSFNNQQSNKYAVSPVTSSQSANHADLSGISEETEKKLIVYNHITYGLYLFSFFTAGLTWLVAIIMNYATRSQAGYSWLASHFDWQIKTFWYSILLTVVSLVMMFFGAGGMGFSFLAQNQTGGAGWIGVFLMGVALLVITFFWHLYRIIRGWIALNDRHPLGQ